jgi:hypothetical protein
MKTTVTDPDRLTGAAREVQTTSTGMAQDVNQLRTAVAGAGEPWGHDEPGQRFGQLYTEVRQLALDTYDSHTRLLTYATDALTGWADDIRGTEDNLTAGFDRLRSGLSG